MTKSVVLASLLALASAAVAATPIRPALSDTQILIRPTVVLSAPFPAKAGVPFTLRGTATATRGLASLLIELDGQVKTLRVSGIGYSLSRSNIRPVPAGRGIHTLIVEATDLTGATGIATVRFQAN